jgi:hypothetical protein
MVVVLAAGYLLCFPAAPKVRRMQKLQIETLTFRVWHGATDRSLNDGQIPHLHGVRVAPGTGYPRVDRSLNDGQIPHLHGVRVAPGTGYPRVDRSLNDGQIPHLHGVRVALGTGYPRVDRSLNDGQIPHLHGVRVALGTGYHRVEGNRRASRNGLVSDLPPEIPTVTIRNLFRRCMHADGLQRRRTANRNLGFGMAENGP